VKNARDLPWAAMSFVSGGRRYTVQHMNHPANPKGTRYSAYRDYGRFGAFPEADLAEGETLTLRYRFAVTAGDPPPRETLQAQHQAFANPPTVEVRQPNE
jgi:hypothetical protein